MNKIKLVVELPQDWENKMINLSDSEIVDFLYGVLRSGVELKIEDIKTELQNMKKEYAIRHDHPRADTLGYALLVIDKYEAESDHKCHNCKHYTSGERDGSCDSYICKNYSDWEREDKDAHNR